MGTSGVDQVDTDSNSAPVLGLTPLSESQSTARPAATCHAPGACKPLRRGRCHQSEARRVHRAGTGYALGRRKQSLWLWVGCMGNGPPRKATPLSLSPCVSDTPGVCSDLLKSLPRKTIVGPAGRRVSLAGWDCRMGLVGPVGVTAGWALRGKNSPKPKGTPLSLSQYIFDSP